MSDVAAFLIRPNAALYARACERYGVDPAAVLDDDYLANQYRVGAGVVATREERAEEQAEPGDEFAATRAAGAALREAVG